MHRPTARPVVVAVIRKKWIRRRDDRHLRRRRHRRRSRRKVILLLINVPADRSDVNFKQVVAALSYSVMGSSEIFFAAGGGGKPRDHSSNIFVLRVDNHFTVV